MARLGSGAGGAAARRRGVQGSSPAAALPRRAHWQRWSRGASRSRTGPPQPRLRRGRRQEALPAAPSRSDRHHSSAAAASPRPSSPCCSQSHPASATAAAQRAQAGAPGPRHGLRVCVAGRASSRRPVARPGPPRAPATGPLQGGLAEARRGAEPGLAPRASGRKGRLVASGLTRILTSSCTMRM